MSRTDCPYLDCRQANVAANASTCPDCIRWLKRCGKCRTPNRSFSNYCRSCREKLPVLNEFWPSSRGGVQRLGLNRQVVKTTPPDLKIEELKTFHFSGRCRSILAEDGYLIVVSDKGMIQVVDLNRCEDEPYSFNAGGKVFAEPALHDGTLYVGVLKDESRDLGGVEAFTLGDVTSNHPEVRQRWALGLNGRPVQALLPFADRLYLNIGFGDARREIHYIENIGRKNPAKPVIAHDGERVSTLVANLPTKKVFFLSKNGADLFVNTFDHALSAEPEMKSTHVKDAPSDILDHIPIAAMGAKLFAVFGDRKYLCRIDTYNNSFDAKISDRVRGFALSGMNRQAMVNSTGIFSTFSSQQEDLIRGEGIVSGPVIIRENTVVVGMRDGKIRFYQMNNLAVQLDYQVFDSQCKVLTLTTFKNMIAVGNQDGGAKLLRLG